MEDNSEVYQSILQKYWKDLKDSEKGKELDDSFVSQLIGFDFNRNPVNLHEFPSK